MKRKYRKRKMRLYNGSCTYLKSPFVSVNFGHRMTMHGKMNIIIVYGAHSLNL